jgi:hypothetical protein
MKTLDKYIIRNFLASAGLWFLVLMSLRIVADLFVNMDEWAKQNKNILDLAGLIFSYYAYNSFGYMIELGGVVVVASAAFTLARMNQTNELTAILASGISLHRVVWPIVFCAMLMSGILVLDQEFIIPQVADKLVRSRDDVPGTRKFPIRMMTDSGKAVWYSPGFSQTEEIMREPSVLVRDENCRLLAAIRGDKATPGREGGKDGWIFVNAELLRSADNASGAVAGAKASSPWPNRPDTTLVWTNLGPDAMLRNAKINPREIGITIGHPEITDPTYEMTIKADRLIPDPPAAGKHRGGMLVNPRFVYQAPMDAKGKISMLAVIRADSARWTPDVDGKNAWKLSGGTLFFPSDLNTDDLALRRSSRWLDYMSSAEMGRLLKSQRAPDPQSTMLVRHSRVVAPINNLIMLLLGLPFILSRERNIKASAGLCTLMVCTFYAFIYICRYMGLPPTWAAWMPILLFGPVSLVMLDSVKT